MQFISYCFCLKVITKAFCFEKTWKKQNIDLKSVISDFKVTKLPIILGLRITRKYLSSIIFTEINKTRRPDCQGQGQSKIPAYTLFSNLANRTT